MKSAALIFPNQLFKDSEIFSLTNNFYLVEYSLFFGEVRNISNFHKNKLILHRASMRNYFENKLNGYNSHYIDYNSSNFDQLFSKFEKVEILYVYEPKDFLLQKRLKRYCKKFDIKLVEIANPGFLTPDKIYNEFFDQHKYFMTSFYIEQRKRLNILINKENKPIGGKWTYDTENRLKLPESVKVPATKLFGENDYVF